MCLELDQDVTTNNLCQWCTIAKATLTYCFHEPIQLNLFHKVLLAITLCHECLAEVKIAEEYALYA